jgi:RTX calcium-binding nonapeptide repeat (4 copies)
MHERPGTLPPSVHNSGTNFTLTPISEKGSEMMISRTLATLGVAGVMCAGFVGVASVSQAAPADKVTICHATGSSTNPYVQITVSPNAVPAHLKQHDGDFVAEDPTTGCTLPVVTPPTDGQSVDCVVSAGVTQTATTVTGTSGDDTIDCTNASPGKTINGLDGNDTITGTAFNDVINGGNGNDTITGGPGDDVIEGGNGNDTLTGSAGNDVVTDTGDGNDTITP